MAQTVRELTIGQVAERTGMSVHALRLYERDGLLVGPVKRTSNGRRTYTESDVEWLLNCTKFRASGMPLATTGNETDRLAILRQHQEKVTQQITELNECLNLITRKVTAYEEHVARGGSHDPWIASVPPGTQSTAPGHPLNTGGASGRLCPRYSNLRPS